MVEPGDFDKDVGEALFLKMRAPSSAWSHAEDVLFQFGQFDAGFGPGCNGFSGSGLENGGHDDFADVMDEAGNVIALAFGGLIRSTKFAGEEGGADAMTPELTPGEALVVGQFLKFLDDGSDHGELANLADAKEEDGFLDVFDGVGQAVIDGVDQVQQAGGQAGIAADDFGDLGGVALVGAESSFRAFSMVLNEGRQEALLSRDSICLYSKGRQSFFGRFDNRIIIPLSEETGESLAQTDVFGQGKAFTSGGVHAGHHRSNVHAPGGNRHNTRYTAALPMRNGAFQPATYRLRAATRVRPGETAVTPATPLHYL